MQLPITGLHMANVGPFDDIDFEFDRHVNVFVGPNNSGKSSALWVLGDITVYPFTFPRKLLHRGKEATFDVHISGVDDAFRGQLPCIMVGPNDESDPDQYWNRQRSLEHIDILEGIGYSKFIPALRRSTDYRSPGPTANRHQDAQTGRPDESVLKSPDNTDYARRRRRIESLAEEEPRLKKRIALVSADASLVSDQEVIQKMIELDYRSYLKGQPTLRKVLDKIGQLASEISEGFRLDFVSVDEDDDGFFPKFSTIDGELPLNTMSQGTQSIIQWLAHLVIGYSEYYSYPDELDDRPGILIIDEIDAHLHPSWQRRIIPTLTAHFPGLQIFCSTHSPLMLAGLKEGQIQLLQRDEAGKICVTRNKVDVDGWTADEIFRNFLGVPDPTDLQTVGRLERLQALRTREDLSADEEEELEGLRSAVSQDLLSGPIPTYLEYMAEALTRAKTDSNPLLDRLSDVTTAPGDRSPGE